MSRIPVLAAVLLAAALAAAAGYKTDGSAKPVVFEYQELRDGYVSVWLKTGSAYTVNGWVNYTASLVRGYTYIKFANDTVPVYLFWIGYPPGSVRLGRVVELRRGGDGLIPVFEAGTLPYLWVSDIRGAEDVWAFDKRYAHYYYGNSTSTNYNVFACYAPVVEVGYHPEGGIGRGLVQTPHVCVSWKYVKHRRWRLAGWNGTQPVYREEQWTGLWAKTINVAGGSFAFRFERPGYVAVMWLSPNGTATALVGYTDYVDILTSGDYVIYYQFRLPYVDEYGELYHHMASGFFSPAFTKMVNTRCWDNCPSLMPGVETFKYRVDGYESEARAPRLVEVSWFAPVSPWPPGAKTEIYGSRDYSLVVGGDGSFKPAYIWDWLRSYMDVSINGASNDLYEYFAGTVGGGPPLKREVEAFILAWQMWRDFATALHNDPGYFHPGRSNAGQVLAGVRKVNDTVYYVSILFPQNYTLRVYKLTAASGELSEVEAYPNGTKIYYYKDGTVFKISRDMNIAIYSDGFIDFGNGTAVYISVRLYKGSVVFSKAYRWPNYTFPGAAYSTVKEVVRAVYVNVTQTVTHTVTQTVTAAPATVTQTVTKTAPPTTVTEVRELTSTATQTVTETAVRREADWGAAAALAAVALAAGAAAGWLARGRR